MWKCPNCRQRVEDTYDVCWACGTSKEGVADPNFARAAAETGVREGRPPAPVVRPALTLAELIFVGLNGYALALHRDSGEIVWSNSEMRSGFVTLLLDGDRLIVSTNGYIYCLDPLTGAVLWNNPLKGYGMGTPTSLVSIRGQSSQSTITQAAVVITAQKSDPG